VGGRRRLVGGFPVWLQDHRKPDGVSFRRALKAGQEITGSPNSSELVRAELSRYAIASVVYQRAARTWGELVDRREHGKGRRPSAREVERAARRLGLADQTLKDAVVRLEALAAKHRQGADPLAELLQSMGKRDG